MLIALAVEPFKERRRREELTAKLFLWMNEISALGVPLTAWIDGSFCTEKESPNDIDICILVEKAGLNALNEEQFVRFEQLTSRPYVRTGYDLDLYVIDADDENEQRQWRELFGKGHDRKTVKGIFVMKAKE